MMLDLAIKELGRHKMRTFLTILGIAIGIMLVTTLSSFSEGIRITIDSEMSYLSGMVMVLQRGSGWTTFQLSEIDESVQEDLEMVPGVERVSGGMVGSVPDIGMIYGFDPEEIDMFDMDIGFEEGRIMEEGAPEIVLGYDFAEHSGYRVGDEVEIRGKKYDVIGVLERTGSEEDSGIVTSFKTAQEILKKEDKVTMFMIKPTKIDEAQNVADEINRLYDDIMAATEEDARRGAEEFTGQISMMTFGMGSIAAIIAGLGIMNVMFMSVRERRKEIGTMKALGATTHQILAEVVFEAVVIALLGAVVGILLSYLAVEALNAELGLMGIARITPGLLVIVTLFAVILGLIGGLLPAREAANLQPAVVLRYE